MPSRGIATVTLAACVGACQSPDPGSGFSSAAGDDGPPLDGDDDGGSASSAVADDDGLDDDGDDVEMLDVFNAGDNTGGCGAALIGVLRDFKADHPDFERDVVGEDYGIVAPTLGDDHKPVYANSTTPTTTDPAAFDQWFRDVDGVNVSLPIKIALVEESPGSFVFDDRKFFPVDGEGFGNEGRPHNYHFTVEIHTEFEYRGGEVFTFRGDDDLFTYVNGHLGIDLGGVHLPLTRTIDMDAVAGDFGLEIGQTYTLDFFFAERHTTLSNFRVETSIDCFVSVPQL